MTTDNKRVEEIAERQADGYEEASKARVHEAAILMLKDIRYLLAEVERLQTELDVADDALEVQVGFIAETRALLAEKDAELEKLSDKGAHADCCEAITRTWKALGIESYADAKGKSINEHVATLTARLAELEGLGEEDLKETAQAMRDQRNDLLLR